MRLLIVGTQSKITHDLEPTLKTELTAVMDAVETGHDALSMVRHYQYDAVILNLHLPDTDGVEVIRRMRAAGRDVPVFALTSSSGTHIKIRAFAAGADDVMVVPFDKDEFCARIKTIVRRSKGYTQAGLRVGPMTMDTDNRDVHVAGQRLRLTPKEYAMLELLALHRGLVVTKDQFLNHLYGGVDEPDGKIIDVYICKLRKKLSHTAAPNLIGTVWGRGYTMRSTDSADDTGSTNRPAQHPAHTERDVVDGCAVSLRAFKRDVSIAPAEPVFATDQQELIRA